jgi:hypothetical protein
MHVILGGGSSRCSRQSKIHYEEDTRKRQSESEYPERRGTETPKSVGGNKEGLNEGNKEGDRTPDQIPSET